MVTFLLLGDLHGDIPKIHFKKFDAIICPGDFCSSESRKYAFKVIEKKQKDPSYDKSWIDLVGEKKAKSVIKKEISAGRKILVKLNKIGVPVFVVPGNADYYSESKSKDFWEKNRYADLIKGLRNIKDCHFKKRTFHGIDIIGYGDNYGPEYPKYRVDKKHVSRFEKRIYKEQFWELYALLGELFFQAKNPVIFLSHNIPFKSGLDKILMQESPKYGYHYGSIVARRVVKKLKPILCVGGHIHEHFGKVMMGKTIVINSGFGGDKNVMVEIEKGIIKEIEFFSKV